MRRKRRGKEKKEGKMRGRKRKREGIRRGRREIFKKKSIGTLETDTVYVG